MKLIRLENESETLWFSTPAKAAKFLSVRRSNIAQSLAFKCRCKGYYVEVVDGGEVMAKDINKNIEE